MRARFPKDDDRFRWTNHVKHKMLFYGLSEQRIKRVLQSPHRVEQGIAPHTVAAMQKNTTRKHPEEIWVMYQPKKMARGGRAASVITMISAWRYPGRTNPSEPIPIPEDIREALESLAETA